MIVDFFLWKLLVIWFQKLIKHWTKPATPSLIIGVLSDLTCSRTNLVVENALLRQQLIVLNRQIKRPQFTNHDRYILILLARCTRFWQQALHIVQPDTLLRWHRELFCFYWGGNPRASRNSPKFRLRLSRSSERWLKKITCGVRSGFGVNC